MTGQDEHDEHDAEVVGSVGEEAAKLLDALSGWAREQQHGLGDSVAGATEAAARAAHGVNEHLATGAPECEVCPVCRTVHLVRSASPEVKAHLATAASSLLQAAAGLLATAAPEPRRTVDDVEHIGLDDTDDPLDEGDDL